MGKLVALAALFPAATLSAQPAGAPLELLTIRVPIDGANPARGSAPIRVGVARALDSRGGGDPVFVLEALGESSVDAATRGLIASLEALRRTHDLVFVDQRGASIAPLLCPPIAEDTAAIFDPRQIAECRRAFERRARLGDLSSRTFAGDVEAVRRRLRYRRIELVGYFYGTRIAEQYIRRWPRRVSAAVLADASPLDYPASKAEAGAISESIASTLRACKADEACNASYPALGAEWEQVSRAPLSAGLLDWLKLRTLRWSSAASWPRDVDAIAKGEIAAELAQYGAYRKTVLASYPLALRIAVDCAEDMPTSALPKATGSAAEQRACARWPVQRIGTPGKWRAGVPILAVAAEFDIEAPATAVRRAFAGDPNAQIVIFPNRARATDNDWSECMGPLVTTFLESRGAAPLDTSCVARLKRPPFAVSAP